MSRRPAPGSRGRTPLPRLLGLDSNPLRRGTDRAEAWLRIGLVVLFLVGAPVATFATGHWADSATRADARAYAATVRQVPATVLQSVPDTAPDPSRGAVDWTPARWRAPDGTAVTGQVQAPLGTPAHARVQIWVDASGHVSEPPLTRGQVLSRVVTAAALTPVAIVLVLAFALGLAHRLLDRRRMLAWEAAWSAVEPHWTKRTR